jgi:hypothetical protein
VLTVALFAVIFPIAAAVSPPPVPPADRQPPSQTPMPYVTVYHDDATSFQVRRDPITRLSVGIYKVWLRWLWAVPRPMKSGVESATMIVAEVDCNTARVRETKVLHKDHGGTIFEVEETKPEDMRWRSFPEDSGAGSALRQVCRIIPELLGGDPKAQAPSP